MLKWIKTFLFGVVCMHKGLHKQVVHMPGYKETQGMIRVEMVPRDVVILTCYKCNCEKIGFAGWAPIPEEWLPK